MAMMPQMQPMFMQTQQPWQMQQPVQQQQAPMAMQMYPQQQAQPQMAAGFRAVTPNYYRAAHEPPQIPGQPGYKGCATCKAMDHLGVNCPQRAAAFAAKAAMPSAAPAAAQPAPAPIAGGCLHEDWPQAGYAPSQAEENNTEGDRQQGGSSDGNAVEVMSELSGAGRGGNQCVQAPRNPTKGEET